MSSMLVDIEAKEFHKMAPVLHSACLLPFNPSLRLLEKTGDEDLHHHVSSQQPPTRTYSTQGGTVWVCYLLKGPS